MALRVVVLDVGERLADETATYERSQAEGVTSLVLADRDLHVALPRFADWGVEKPAAGFSARIVEEASVPAEEILYVGDRVVRRGAHADVESPDGAVRIESLTELPGALADG